MRITNDDPVEVLDDILSLFAKVLHDNEVESKVAMADLVEILETIIRLRRHISTAGFKSIPKLQKGST